MKRITWIAFSLSIAACTSSSQSTTPATSADYEDAAETIAASTAATSGGSVDLTASIDRQGTWTITGLQSATATFNGDSSFSLDTTLTSIFHQGVTSSFMLDATASYDAIQIATADRQVTGGTASFELKAHRTVTGTAMGSHDVDKSFDIHAELTFNGDHTATLVLDGAQTFTIDLKTGRVSKAS
jgi:hypothetical protein